MKSGMKKGLNKNDLFLDYHMSSSKIRAKLNPIKKRKINSIKIKRAKLYGGWAYRHRDDNPFDMSDMNRCPKCKSWKKKKYELCYKCHLLEKKESKNDG